MNKNLAIFFGFTMIFLGISIGLSLGLTIGGLMHTFTLIMMVVLVIGGTIAVFCDWFKLIQQNDEYKGDGENE